MARFLYIIARDRRDLYESLKENFAAQPDVAVVLDRRHRERRTVAVEPPKAELRRGDRRRQRELDRELRSTGSFITATSDVVLVVF